MLQTASAGWGGMANCTRCHWGVVGNKRKARVFQREFTTRQLSWSGRADFTEKESVYGTPLRRMLEQSLQNGPTVGAMLRLELPVAPSRSVIRSGTPSSSLRKTIQLPVPVSKSVSPGSRFVPASGSAAVSGAEPVVMNSRRSTLRVKGAGLWKEWKLIVPISAGLKVSVGEFRFRLRKAVRGRMILLQRAPSGTGSRVPNRLIPAGVRRGSLSNTTKQFGVPFSRFTQSDSALHEDGMLQSRPANRVPFAFGMVSSMAAFPSAASRVNWIEGAGSPARCQVHQGGSPEEPPCEAESIRLKLSTTLPAASSGRRTAEKSGSVNVFIVEEESCYFASR